MVTVVVAMVWGVVVAVVVVGMVCVGVRGGGILTLESPLTYSREVTWEVSHDPIGGLHEE